MRIRSPPCCRSNRPFPACRLCTAAAAVTDGLDRRRSGQVRRHDGSTGHPGRRSDRQGLARDRPQGTKGEQTKVIVAGDEVKNFDQIKVGDQVIAKYTQELVMTLKKGGGELRERIDSSQQGSAATR
jgi:hypothetical protein